MWCCILTAVNRETVMLSEVFTTTSHLPITKEHESMAKKAKPGAMTPVKKHDNQFFSDIAALLAAARGVAYRAVNAVMVETYWQIGRRIVEQEQNGKDRADYGDYLIVNLSRYLTDTFGKGFSEANLWNFRQFYLTFLEFSTHCVGNLSWTNIRLIMRLDDADERANYLKETAAGNWACTCECLTP